MNQGLVHLHNVLRWVILILIVIAVFRHLSAMNGKKAFTAGDRKRGTLLMIFANIQFVLGLIMWFIGPWGYKLINSVGMSGIMKDPVYRFWVMEHNISMIIAIALISIGKAVARKPISDEAKHKRSFWLFLFALILIIIAIPWPGRVMGRPLFPGFN